MGKNDNVNSFLQVVKDFFKKDDTQKVTAAAADALAIALQAKFGIDPSVIHSMGSLVGLTGPEAYLKVKDALSSSNSQLLTALNKTLTAKNREIENAMSVTNKANAGQDRSYGATKHAYGSIKAKARRKRDIAEEDINKANEKYSRSQDMYAAADSIASSYLYSPTFSGLNSMQNAAERIEEYV